MEWKTWISSGFYICITIYVHVCRWIWLRRRSRSCSLSVLRFPLKSDWRDGDLIWTWAMKEESKFLLFKVEIFTIFNVQNLSSYVKLLTFYSNFFFFVIIITWSMLSHMFPCDRFNCLKVCFNCLTRSTIARITSATCYKFPAEYQRSHNTRRSLDVYGAATAGHYSCTFSRGSQNNFNFFLPILIVISLTYVVYIVD